MGCLPLYRKLFAVSRSQERMAPSLRYYTSALICHHSDPSRTVHARKEIPSSQAWVWYWENSPGMSWMGLSGDKSLANNLRRMREMSCYLRFSPMGSLRVELPVACAWNRRASAVIDSPVLVAWSRDAGMQANTSVSSTQAGLRLELKELLNHSTRTSLEINVMFSVSNLS